MSYTQIQFYDSRQVCPVKNNLRFWPDGGAREEEGDHSRQSPFKQDNLQWIPPQFAACFNKWEILNSNVVETHWLVSETASRFVWK